MTRQEAERVVAAALAEHGIRSTVHCRERMIQRGIRPTAVRRVLRTGTFSDPRWDEAYGDWEVVCTGRTAEGERLRVRLVIAGTAVWLVTVYAVR